MLKRAIKYQLDWDIVEDWLWHQPYEILARLNNISFEWWIIQDDWWYLGILTYPIWAITLTKVNNWIAKNDFKVVILTNQEAIDRYSSCVEDSVGLMWETILKSDLVNYFISRLT